MHQLEAAIGGFSRPSKLPGYAWSIPAKGCITGAKLAKVPGSVCSTCYALKGRYVFPNVQEAMQRRETIWKRTPTDVWVSNMASAMQHVYKNKTGDDRVFRWFDSGDLRSSSMLDQTIDIAIILPSIKFWLPTREVSILQNWKKSHASGVVMTPSNLVIRVSSPMVDDPPAPWASHTSTVVSEKSNATCPAYKQSNQCGSCRACWDRQVKNIAYPKH